MLYLKKLNLKNYCGYASHSFDFTKPDGEPYRYICFYGPNGIGKCVTSSCYINTYEHGTIAIGSLFSKYSLTPDTWYDSDFQIDVGGEYFPVHKIYYNGKKKTAKITTSSGFFLEGSYDKHQILSVRDNKIQFTKISELRQGDQVCVSKKSQFPNTCPISSTMSSILGYLIAEGCINKNTIQFFNSDADVNFDFCKLIKQEFDITIVPRTNLGSTCSRTTVPKQIHKHLYDAGLGVQLSGDKRVPKSVLSGTREVIQSFLRSYFEGDGGAENDIQAITCCSKSYQLMHQIHLLLLRLGIISSLHKKNTKKLSYNEKPYTSWRITIQGEDVLKYARNIGFISSRKIGELDDLLLSMSLTQRNPNKDIIPSSLLIGWSQDVKNIMNKHSIEFDRAAHKETSNGLHCLQPNYLRTVKYGVSRDKIRACIQTINGTIESYSGDICCLIKEPECLNNDYYFDQIKSIEYGEDDLFDVCVEDKHSFWSNGFISHNSTLLEAISMLTANWSGRGDAFIQQSLQKYVRNIDYDPTWQKVIDDANHAESNSMLIEGVYSFNNEEYVIQLSNNGYIRNDFAPIPASDLDEDAQEMVLQSGPWGKDHLKYRQRIAHFIKSDSDLSMHKFQLHYSQKERFERIVSTIMRYPAVVTEPSGFTSDEMSYCTDVTIEKKGHKIHFKRMSAGERKICKSFSEILNAMRALEHPSRGEPPMLGWPKLLLIDNIVMHVYYDRHVQMIECLKQVFDKQQIFATTHSGVLIQRFLNNENDRHNELMIDLEKVNG